MAKVRFNSFVSRVRYQVRRHGFRATVGKAVGLARPWVYVDETNVWYELRLGTDRPEMHLPPGLTLVRGGARDLPLLEELPTVSPLQARQMIENGKDLWLVLDEQHHPVFAVWIYNDVTPVRSTRGGQLKLPPNIVCMEKSVVSPSYRGRGALGPPTWSQIADELERTTAVESVTTKAEEGNKVMRWALGRAGFREVATTRARRVGLWRHLSLQARTGTVAEWLAQQIPSSRATS